MVVWIIIIVIGIVIVVVAICFVVIIVIIIVILIRIEIPGSKNEARIVLLLPCHPIMDLVNYVIRHRHCSGVQSIKNSFCRHAKEIETLLAASDWSQCQCTDCPRVHGVVVLLVGLSVLTKLETTMVFVINFLIH